MSTTHSSYFEEGGTERRVTAGYRQSIRPIIHRAKRGGVTDYSFLSPSPTTSECRHILTPALYSIAHPTQDPDNTLAPAAQTCFFASADFRAEYPASCARFRIGKSTVSRLHDADNGLFSSRSLPPAIRKRTRENRLDKERENEDREGKGERGRGRGRERQEIDCPEGAGSAPSVER